MSPTDTGWTWNGVPWNNPPGCHVYQQMILVQTEATVPARSATRTTTAASRSTTR